MYMIILYLYGNTFFVFIHCFCFKLKLIFFLKVHTYANVIHRDIKPENLLVDENDVLKLADFGVSTIMENGNDQLSTNAGTKAFLAPETWDGKPFKGKKADVWAAAATLYFLVVGKLPFHATNAEDLKKKITEDQFEQIFH